MQLLKIMKINILSIIALPLFLLSVAGQLMARAMEKIVVLLGAVVLVLMSTLAAEFVKDHGSTGGEIVLSIVGLVIGGGLILFVLSVASALCTGAAEIVSSICEWVYEKSYDGYEYLFDICEEDYNKLRFGNRFVRGICCLFYILLYSVNKVLVFLIRHCLKIFILLSVILVGGTLYYFDIMAKRQLQMSLLAYLKSCNMVDLIYICLIFVIVMGAVVTVLISLGTEWSEWGLEMEMVSSGSAIYRNQANEFKNAYQTPPAEDSIHKERAEKYSKMLKSHIDTLDAFAQDVENLLDNGEHMVLRTSFGEYMSALGAAMALLKKYDNSLSENQFSELMHLIEKMEQLKLRILKQMEKIQSERKTRTEADSFFGGCDTKEKLDKRYRALCKVYHPDGENGDTETFVRMREEYEKRIAQVG